MLPRLLLDSQRPCIVTNPYCFLFVGLCVLLMTASACSFNHPVAPEPSFIEDDLLQRVDINHSVALINNQQNAGETLLCSAAVHHWKGDLVKFADTAIRVLQDALERKQVRVDNTSESILKLSISKAVCEQGMWTFGATVALTVQTGDGLVREFESSQYYPNGYMTTWAMERAITYAIMDLLKDKEMMAYLNSESPAP